MGFLEALEDVRVLVGEDFAVQIVLVAFHRSVILSAGCTRPCGFGMVQRLPFVPPLPPAGHPRSYARFRPGFHCRFLFYPLARSLGRLFLGFYLIPLA